MTFSTPFLGLSLAFFAMVFGASSLLGSPSSDEEIAKEPQVASGIALPLWEDGDACETFDTRIWPEIVTAWLEQENLRDLIADPRTTDEVRQSLKRILALQRAWRLPSS